MKPVDFLIIGLILLILAAAIRKIILNKKNGKCSCGCSCSGCEKCSKSSKNNI